jgi:hypothetical protein
MNLYFILAVVIAWGASVGGAFFYGEGLGKDAEIAGQAKISQAIQDTKAAAQQGAAEVIAALKPVNTTIVQKVQHEREINTIYATCKLPPDGLQLANQALTGRSPEPASGDKLPAVVAPK